MTAAMTCAHHPDRHALGYCRGCGKPLCRTCLVRLSTGDYCERCAGAGDRPGQRTRQIPWWAVAVIALAALILLHAVR